MMIVFGLYLLLVSVVRVTSHAVYMTQSQYCSRALTPGTTIMSNSVTSSASRTVQVYRGGTLLSSGDPYVFGESLTIKLSSTSGEYVLQSSGASFSGGKCTSGTRVANSQGTLVMPSSGSTTVTVLGGWASSQSTVYVSSTVSLTAPVSVTTQSPSQNPTRAPTALTPTLAPTTGSPVISSYPTVMPTTTTPTVAPTSSMPSQLPTSRPTLPAPPVPVEAQEDGIGIIAKFITGILVGIGGFAVFFVSMFAYARGVQQGKIVAQDANSWIVRISAWSACVLAVIGTGLVGSWAKNNTTTDFGYLGQASWSTNPLAYHPTLMVGGFFMGQVFAVCSWSVLYVHYNAKLIHVMWHSGALFCMIAGFVAIVKHMNDSNSSAFATMHSWIGVAAIALFGLTYMWGSIMALLTRFNPSSVLRKSIDLRFHHRSLGVLSMILTVAAVVTGVMDHLPQGVCYYQVSTSETTGFDADSAAFYERVPISCRIGLGVGVATVCAATLALYAVAGRGDSFHISQKQTVPVEYELANHTNVVGSEGVTPNVNNP